MKQANQHRYTASRDWHHIKRAVHSTVLLAIAAMAAGCRTVPVDQRRQVLLIPEAREILWSRDLYAEVLAENPSSNQPALMHLVQRVGWRIARATQRPEYEWEFRVIRSPEPNAFCLPGGKVAVYEGILPICQNEAGLATILAHQIGHALARHGGERISREYLFDAIAASPRMLTDRWTAWRNQRLIAAYGLTSTPAELLPYSQQHEREADRIGLLIMARAGYDPNEAPRFWRRLTATADESQTSPLLVNHPSYANRISSMAQWLAEAVEVYAQGPTQLGVGQSISRSLVQRPTDETSPDASRFVSSQTW